MVLKKLYLFLSVFLLTSNLFAENGLKNQKISGSPEFTFFNINKISTFIFDDGSTDRTSFNNAGFEYPKRSRKFLVFSSGLIWGAKIDSNVRVGGSTFISGLQGGKILDDGNAENHGNEDVRVFRVRRAFKDINNRDNIDITSELVDQEGTREQIKNQYIKDWNEWPVSKGAPFEDINNDGVYDPNIDIPGIPGADQTIWYVANDLNPNLTFNFFGSPPLGIEMQSTFWGYDNIGPLENIMFRKYVLINKSQKTFEDMYISLWMDPDIGDANNDLVACDTTLDLGYTYNSEFYDDVYGNFAPTVGFKLLQGPIVEGNNNDKANFLGREILGKRNAGMSSFNALFKCCPPESGDPVQGDYYLGTLNWYEYLKGNVRTGQQIYVPDQFGGGTTTTPFSGDPIKSTGWLDGVFNESGDRRMGLGVGPITMAPQDTQEVIYAHIAAGGENSINNLSAVALLHQYAEYSQFVYDNNFITDFEVPAPNVNIDEADKSILLSWSEKTESIKEIENYSNNGHSFQGYSIYQFSHPAEKITDAVRISTFDRIDGIDSSIILSNGLNYYGSDNGIKRNIIIDKDYIENSDLINGREYFFGVTAYTYSKDSTNKITSFESFPQIFKVIPQSNAPGISSVYNVGDNLQVIHNLGNSNASISAVIKSPKLLTGDKYKITFSETSGKIFINIENNNSALDIISDFEISEDIMQNFYFDGISVDINNSGFTLSANDVYEFETEKTMYNREQAIKDVQKINVFPNPFYYVVETNSTVEYPEAITFNHLPEKTTIRVYNVAGQVMKIIHKNSNSQFLKWDLFTNWGLRVPSGLYVIYIELPDLGTTKNFKACRYIILRGNFISSYLINIS